MKLDKQDWRKLQTPLLVLGVVVITVCGLFAAAQVYSTNQETAMQTQKNQLNAARQRYQSSGAEKDMITAYFPLYQALISKGFVGEERRIEWVEELRAQHNIHKLFGIKYSISPQTEYKPTFMTDLGSFVLHRSIMKLDLDMLHEGDLLQLTESLNSKKTSPFMLRDCEITRLNGSSVFSHQLIANLHAQCELDWLTLREPATAIQPEVSP
ncbi:hypothetical protein GALL_256280 [mine drainage metagenome]|uniref:Uncharacterized protein n=1 Tax=mine drainage metagenome TaxID=410659 RepID=A0A1J5RKA2_9ZZZZ